MYFIIAKCFRTSIVHFLHNRNEKCITLNRRNLSPITLYINAALRAFNKMVMIPKNAFSYQAKKYEMDPKHLYRYTTVKISRVFEYLAYLQIV